MFHTKCDFTVEVNELNLYKIMNPNYDDAVRGHIREGLKLIIPKVESTVNPCAFYAFVDNRVYVFVTLGEEINQIGSELWDEDEYFNALLLDNFLTQYLFDLSRALYRLIKKDIKLTGKGLGKRQTPGDDLPLEMNKTIMAILKEQGEIKATCNDSFVLSPAKSLAYYYQIEDTFSCLNEDLSCQDCKRDTCLMR